VGVPMSCLSLSVCVCEGVRMPVCVRWRERRNTMTHTTKHTRTHIHAHADTHIRTHMQPHSLFLSLQLFLSHTHSLSRSLSRSLSGTHTQYSLTHIRSAPVYSYDTYVQQISSEMQQFWICTHLRIYTTHDSPYIHIYHRGVDAFIRIHLIY